MLLWKDGFRGIEYIDIDSKGVPAKIELVIDEKLTRGFVYVEVDVVLWKRLRYTVAHTYYENELKLLVIDSRVSAELASRALSNPEADLDLDKFTSTSVKLPEFIEAVSPAVLQGHDDPDLRIKITTGMIGIYYRIIK